MIAARLVLAAFVAACLAWLVSIDLSQRITTDVLDLLPADERSPELSLVRSLSADVQARVVLLALHDSASSAPPSEPAVAAFLSSLRTSNVMDEVAPHADPAQREALGRALFERRFELLLPAWLERMHAAFSRANSSDTFAAWTAARAAAELESFLAQPEAMPLQDLIPSDPLLLVPRVAHTLGDFDTLPHPTNSFALVWARLRASPLSDAGQAPVFAAIENALASARTLQPTLALQWTGINRFAAASRARIQREVAVLNLASVAAVFAVAALFLRRPWQILHLLPIVLLSLLGAWTATTLVFAQVHVLVFVIGALLAGVAIDYGFYIALQPPAPDNPSYTARLRPILRPLVTSCFTTVIGFSLLAFAELPLLRQVGLFVGSGVLCALASALLWFAATKSLSLSPRALPLLDRGRFSSRRIPFAFLALAALLALAAPALLEWRDDIRELEIPSADLRANDRTVRALFGDTPNRSAYLTFGDNLPHARAQLDRFVQHVENHAADLAVASLGTLFPTEHAWRTAPARLEQLADFPDRFRAALEQRDFDPAAFASFFSTWSAFTRARPAADYAQLYRDFLPHLPAPLRQSFQPFAPRPWFLSVINDSRDLSLPSNLDTVPVRQLETFNELFSRYRTSAARLSLIGLGLVLLSVMIVYRDRRAIRILLIPAGACFSSLGLLSLLGHPLNLFHLLGAFLGVCLAHDYAIFTSASAQAQRLPASAVRVSALTTFASFAVLGFSQIPVIHALGTTVALVVSIALLAIEIEARTPPPA